jgi:hypothetical protein
LPTPPFWFAMAMIRDTPSSALGGMGVGPVNLQVRVC